MLLVVFVIALAGVQVIPVVWFIDPCVNHLKSKHNHQYIQYSKEMNIDINLPPVNSSKRDSDFNSQLLDLKQGCQYTLTVLH